MHVDAMDAVEKRSALGITSQAIKTLHCPARSGPPQQPRHVPPVVPLLGSSVLFLRCLLPLHCTAAFTCSSYHRLNNMAEDDESEAFCKLLSDLQVPQVLHQSLMNSGIASIADYAYAYNSTADLSHFIALQPDQLWQDLGVQDPEHCPATAPLRRALDKCKTLTQLADGTASTSQPSAASALHMSSQSTATNVWAEHAPPRLDRDAVNKLVAKFRSNYPSEHLDSHTRPSIRLLSLVHQWFKPHGTIRWIPWQLRMLEKTHQELIEKHSAHVRSALRHSSLAVHFSTKPQRSALHPEQ